MNRSPAPHRRLALSAAVVMSGLTVLAAAPSASAATQGNLETKGPLYYCDGGHPQMVIFARALKTAEVIGYTSAYGSDSLGTSTPGKTYGSVFTNTSDWAGVKTDITFTGKTTGNTIKVAISVPASCKGLVNGQPSSGWEGAPNQSATSTATQSSSSTSSSATSSSSTSTVSPSSSSSASSTSAAPTTSTTVSGPPVQTDYVAKDGGNTLALGGLGLLVVGAVVTGGVATRRLGGS